MQLVALYAILLAVEELRGHGGHGAAQHISRRDLKAPAVDQGEESVEARPVYFEKVGDGIPDGPG